MSDPVHRHACCAKSFIGAILLAALVVGGRRCFVGQDAVVSRIGTACRAGSQGGWWRDSTILSWMAGGNAAFICHDLRPETDPQVASLLAGLYFRANYVACPRRIYVAPTSVVVNEAKDFAGTGWFPSLNFVREHRIGTVVHFARDAHGELHVWADDVAGAATNPSTEGSVR